MKIIDKTLVKVYESDYEDGIYKYQKVLKKIAINACKCLVDLE